MQRPLRLRILRNALFVFVAWTSSAHADDPAKPQVLVTWGASPTPTTTSDADERLNVEALRVTTSVLPSIGTPFVLGTIAGASATRDGLGRLLGPLGAHVFAKGASELVGFIASPDGTIVPQSSLVAIGTVLAIGFDAAALARDATREKCDKSPTASLSFAPAGWIDARGASIGIAARF